MSSQDTIDSTEITILVHGKIEKQTKDVLNNIRKLFKDSPIILSTWRGSDITGLDFDILVENKDPGAKIFNAPSEAKLDEYGFACFSINGKKYKNIPKPNNVNRIIKTVQAGIEKVQTKYCLRLRTDLILKNKNFLNYWNKYPDRDSNFTIFKHRILNSSTFAQFAHVMKKDIQLLPFHMSDWIHFGLTEDIKLLYSCPFQDIEASSQYWYKHVRAQYEPFVDSGWQYPPETYVLYSLVKKKFPNISFKDSDSYNCENMIFSNKIIANNFVMIDDNEFSYSVIKYPQITQWCPELYNGFITHREWLNLYKTYCDPQYKYNDIDLKRIRYFKRFFDMRFFLKYPGKYFRLFKDFSYIFNKNNLRKKFYIGEKV